MKKLITVFFSVAMMFSLVFIGEAISSNGSPSFKIQTTQVTVKRRKKGIARRTYRGGRYVVRRVYVGGRWVTRKVWVGTKWTGKKTWKTSRKVVSRTKKIVY